MNYIEFSAKVEPLEIGKEILIAELAEIGFESFIDFEEGIRAYIKENDFKNELINDISLIANPNFKIQYEIKQIQNQNWNKTWEESFSPIIVNDECAIRAPFHDNFGLQYEIVINPQMSFGTGHPETTYLMIEKMLGLEMNGDAVLDMGCGTGVLAILAAKKGATKVVAIDIDDWAYENTLENIRNNSCEEILVKKGGAELIEGLSFNLILANINRNILLNDIKYYSKALQHLLTYFLINLLV